MSRAIISPMAESDMRESFDWYAQRDSDLALQFMMCVRQTVDAIEKSPLRFPIVVADIRKATVKKFPFAVWYVTDGDSVVIACIHAKRQGSATALERLRALGPKSQ